MSNALPSISVEERRTLVGNMRRQKIRPQEMLRYFREQGNVDVKIKDIYNDIQFLTDQVKEWYYGQAKGDLLASHKLSIEVMEERQRKLMLIETDPSAKTKDRIYASAVIAEIEATIHNWLPLSKALMEYATQLKPATVRRLEADSGKARDERETEPSE